MFSPDQIVQLQPLEVADLPFTPEASLNLRCVGFRAEDAGTVTVVMKPRERAAATHVLPVDGTTGYEWRGHFTQITDFETTTKIWLYLTDIFD